MFFLGGFPCVDHLLGPARLGGAAPGGRRQCRRQDRSRGHAAAPSGFKNARNVRAAFLKDVEKKQEAIKNQEAEVRKSEEEFNRLAPSALEERKRKAEQIKKEARELQHLREDAEGELKRKDAEITQKVIGEIMQVIRNYARNERFTLILDRMAVITADESVDITERIIKLYDSQKK